MGQTTTPIQQKISFCLEKLQILTQNNAITIQQKNHIVGLLLQSRKTGDMTELNRVFRTMAFGTTFPEIIEQLIDITVR